jgi:acyl carrier protein
MDSPDMTAKIREIVRQHGRLTRDMASVTDDADLYASGLTSHASVTLMLALEDAFEIEFPERMLRRRTFETVANIAEAIAELRVEQSFEGEGSPSSAS